MEPSLLLFFSLEDNLIMIKPLIRDERFVKKIIMGDGQQTFHLQKNDPKSKREMRVLENLYSGTFSRSATLFTSILQKSPQVTSHVTRKT